MLSPTLQKTAKGESGPTDINNLRDPVNGVNPLFYDRWSPRNFDKKVIPMEALSRIFDAARWSPSCFNEQPWRFFTCSIESFNNFLDLLEPDNQEWAKNADILGFIVNRRQFSRNGNTNYLAKFDCGAAWMAMTFQARLEGFYTHAMAGIRFKDVGEYLGINPDTEQVAIGFAIGHIATGSVCSQMTGRLPLQDIWQVK